MRLAVPKAGRYRTKQEFVYQTLREAIVNCELAPDERLVIDELARRLEVSSIPVREALQLLQSEGLVVTVPHVGATVAPISRESIAEVFTVMEGLETVASRVAAQRATGSDLEELAQIVATMDGALAAGAHDEWAELNRRFHTGISALTGMPMLIDMMERALDRWDRVRRFFFTGVLVHRVEHAQREHHALLDTMRRKDLTRLEETIREHNRGALAAYTSYLDANRGEGSGAPQDRAR